MPHVRIDSWQSEICSGCCGRFICCMTVVDSSSIHGVYRVDHDRQHERSKAFCIRRPFARFLDDDRRWRRRFLEGLCEAYTTNLLQQHHPRQLVLPKSLVNYELMLAMALGSRSWIPLTPVLECTACLHLFALPKSICAALDILSGKSKPGRQRGLVPADRQQLVRYFFAS